MSTRFRTAHWKTTTFLAALRNDRIDAPCLYDGPINGERFLVYVEQFLVPTLKPGEAIAKILESFPPLSAPRSSGTQVMRKPIRKLR